MGGCYRFKKLRDTSSESRPFNKPNTQQVPSDSMIQAPRGVKEKKLLDFTQLFPPWLYTNKPNGKDPYNTQPCWLVLLTTQVRTSQPHTRSSYATSGNWRLVFVPCSLCFGLKQPCKDSLTSENRTIHPLLPSKLTETCYYSACEVWVDSGGLGRELIWESVSCSGSVFQSHFPALWNSQRILDSPHFCARGGLRGSRPHDVLGGSSSCHVRNIHSLRYFVPKHCMDAICLQLWLTSAESRNWPRVK